MEGSAIGRPNSSEALCDLGNILLQELADLRDFYETNLELGKPGSPISIFDADKAIVSRGQILPPSIIHNCEIHDSLVGEGSILVVRLRLIPRLFPASLMAYKPPSLPCIILALADDFPIAAFLPRHNCSGYRLQETYRTGSLSFAFVPHKSLLIAWTLICRAQP